MPREPRSLLIVLTLDRNWYRTVAQALLGLAQVIRLDSPSQVERRLDRQETGRTAVLLDVTAVPDVETQAGYVRAWRDSAPVGISCVIPSWRDAVTLLQAGAADYVARSHHLAQLRQRLGRLLNAVPA
jgi:DNA-binding response OmpR family regulator